VIFQRDVLGAPSPLLSHLLLPIIL